MSDDVIVGVDPANPNRLVVAFRIDEYRYSFTGFITNGENVDETPSNTELEQLIKRARLDERARILDMLDVFRAGLEGRDAAGAKYVREAKAALVDALRDAEPLGTPAAPCSVCQAEDAEERCEGCKVALCDEHALRDVEYVPLCKECYADSALDTAVEADGDTAGEPTEER